MRLDTDAIAKEDQLNRRVFAQQIAKGLISGFPNGSESLVFGLNGPWGSGKSTLLSYIIDEVQKEDGKEKDIEYRVFEFNPWMFSGQNQLQRQFFQQLSRAVPSSKDRVKSSLKKISGLLDKMTAVKFLNSGLGEGIKSLNDLSKKLSREESLLEIKSKINDILIEKNIRLLITVDDLDRLTPNEVLDVFQLIKLNSNFRNTIFLLAYDKGVITSYLQGKFKSNAEKYIDKIIQVDYRVPAIPDGKIKDMFLNSLQELGEELKVKIPIGELDIFWETHGLRHYFLTVRDIKRFLNALRMRLPGIHTEVFLRDFIVIEAVRVFDYAGYESIYHRRSMINRYEDVNSELKKVWDSSSNYIQKIDRALFNYELDDEYSSSLDPDKKIRDSEYFDRYFTLFLDGNDIGEIELSSFLKDSAARRSIIKRNVQSRKLGKFFRHVSARIDSIKKSISLDLSIIDVLIDHDKGSYSLEIDLVSQAMTILDIIQGVLDSQNDTLEAYKYFLNKLLPQGTDNYSVTRFYFLHYILLCIDDGFKHDFQEQKVLFLKKRDSICEFLKEFTGSWLLHVVHREKEEWNSMLFYRTFLSRFVQLNPETCEKRLSDILYQDWSVLNFLKSLTVFGSNGSPIRVRHESKLEILQGEILEMFKERVKKVDQELLTTRDREILAFHCI